MNIIIKPSYSINLPNQLGATCWYDACRHGTLESGNNVSSWTDLTGNGYHLLQTTDSVRPTWTDAQQRGRPALVFGGSHRLYTSANWSPGKTASLIAVCCRTDNNTNDAGICGAVYPGRTVAGPGIKCDYRNPNNAVYGCICRTNAAGQSNNFMSSTRYNVPVIAVATIDIDNTTSDVPTFRQNGVAGTPSSGLQTANMAGTQFFAGNTSNSGDHLVGWIGEIVVFSRVITATEITRVEQYLSQKWAIKLG